MADPNNTNTPRTPPSAQSGKPAPASPPKSQKTSIQAPKGTRDLYPEDANLRRFITEAWRNTSIRHGFEEIDGPTFEDANLYKVKSGEGILAEMFGVYSGKSDEDRTAVQADPENPPYALRPEFTPTLARMYAARAAQLPKPTKWFTAGPFFRAERPQRGRLREFLQWNVDFIGLPAVAEPSDPNAKGAKASAEGAKSSPEVAQACSLSSGAARASNPQPSDPLAEARARADAECIACCVDFLRSLGLREADVRVKINDRASWMDWMLKEGVTPDLVQPVFLLLDSRTKMSEAEIRERGDALRLPVRVISQLVLGSHMKVTWDLNKGHPSLLGLFRPMQRLVDELVALGVGQWCEIDSSIVRGLAYYTGMVFEVIADGERAVAGGGRYDNLIELFGGPPTPAVGFGMGDVVLTNLLRDKGLLPEGQTLLDRLSQTPASLRPDAFVITADESLDPIVRRLVADLRRGSTTSADTPPKGGMAVARHSHADAPDAADPKHGCAEPQPWHTRGSRPLHARHPYKSTRNVGKLLKDAAAQHARYAVIIENPRDATIKDMTTGRQHWCPIDRVPAWLRSALTR